MKTMLMVLLMIVSVGLHARQDAAIQEEGFGYLVCEYSNGDGWSMMTNNLASWSRASRLCSEGGGTPSGQFGS